MADFVQCNEETKQCQLIGDITSDYTLIAGYEWVLTTFHTVGAGNVNISSNAQMQEIIDAGVTLTIEPSVSIKALEETSLLVTRGSKLIANGTVTAPITFSSADEDYDGEGEWGGVIIQGFAPQYGTGNSGECC